MATLIVFAVLFLLMFLRVPIAISLGLSSILGLLIIDFSITTVIQRMFTSLNNTVLMAIPGFIYSGLIIARGGVSKYLIEFIISWMGHIRGGLSIVTVITCMIFAAISGSSPATAAAVGTIMIPMMIKGGYDVKYAIGLVAAAGTLGILIPPSVALILYASVSQESVRDLFNAGIVPGILLGCALIVYAVIEARRKNYKGSERVPFAERISPTIKAFWGLIMPVLILFSIYTGIVTPTEASFLSVLYAIVVSVFIYRELDWKKFVDITKESVETTAMIFLIISSATILGMFLTAEQIPQTVATWVNDANMNKWTFLVIISLLFFILGMFLEASSIILITLPIILPIIIALDINVVHFAIIMVVNMELGMITPPVGVNLFVVSGIANQPLERVIRGIIPFYSIFLIVLAILIIFPAISLVFLR